MKMADQLNCTRGICKTWKMTNRNFCEKTWPV